MNYLGCSKLLQSLAVALLVGLALLINHSPARADISSCSAQVYLHSTDQGSNPDFQFQVSNNDTNPINWIGISTPSDNFVIISSNASGWNSSSSTQQATYTNNTINPGDSFDQITVNAIATTASPTANWTFQVSDDPGGANPYQCTGQLGTSITSPGPVISNISISKLSSSGVTISWDTDTDSTSQVHYGLNDSYGSTTTLDNALTSHHVVAVKHLSANTGYHYQVESTTPGGGDGLSADNTFLTAILETGSNRVSSAPINLVITNPGDKTPPAITISTDLPNIVESIPPINGTATDDLAVVRIEYSTDSGRNWLPVGDDPAIGGKSVNFSFTPSNLDDGNYEIVARAIDAGGNIALTTPIGVVIDRLPPLVGGSVVSLGPQILTNANGTISTQSGVDEKINLSAVGGPTSIILTTKTQNLSVQARTFDLTQSPDTGLWSGIISFNKPGTYLITATSLDGAGNKTSKLITSVSAVPMSKIVDSKTKQPLPGRLTVYTMQPDSNNWVVWDGPPYGQANPQPIAKDGQFSFLLPAGKYYLKADASGHHSFNSDIFNLGKPSPISVTIGLRPGHDYKFMSWANLSGQKISLSNVYSYQTDGGNMLVGQSAPKFNLGMVNGQSIKNDDLLGRPADLVFMSTWAPTTSEQLPALKQLVNNSEAGIYPLAAQEGSARLKAYNKISGYNLNWLADPDSTTSGSFATPSLPTHYFIDRNGIVRHVISGVLNKQEILDNLAGL